MLAECKRHSNTDDYLRSLGLSRLKTALNRIDEMLAEKRNAALEVARERVARIISEMDEK